MTEHWAAGAVFIRQRTCHPKTQHRSIQHSQVLSPAYSPQSLPQKGKERKENVKVHLHFSPYSRLLPQHSFCGTSRIGIYISSRIGILLRASVYCFAVRLPPFHTVSISLLLHYLHFLKRFPPLVFPRRIIGVRPFHLSRSRGNPSYDR